MKEKTNKKYTPSFLLPGRVIKARQFTKKDINQIKTNLMKSLSVIYLIAAITFMVLFTAMTIFMNSSSNGDIAGKYGKLAFVGLILLISGSFVTATLIIISRLIKNKSISITLLRISGDLLYISIAIYMLFAIYSDAEKGFTTQTEALSASIIFVAILVLIQPMHWSDATVLNLATTIGIIVVAIICKYNFDMKAIYYYGLIALFFPFCCYMVVTLLFYAESQRYIEMLENERLHNNAYYDSLTQCKNRYSLTDFLKENGNRWSSGDTNLLIALFDIDDFRLYNSEFSHLGGDYCLKAMCDAIRREFSSPNLDFFRYGGEEFLLFFELEQASDGPIYLRRIRNAINSLDITAPKGAPKDKVTVSVGGIMVNIKKAFNFEDEMKAVDRYLYQAKESGKDAICYNGSIINN